MSRGWRAQDGMTLVEVLVAATILLIGVASTFAVVSGGQRLSVDAQREEQAVGVAQTEIEELRALPYDKIGLTSTPIVTSTVCNAASTNPNDWLRAGVPPTLLISTSYRDCAGSTPAGVPAAGEPLVCGNTSATGCTTAAVAPGPTSVTIGTDGTTGKIYRFVSWRQETTCTSATGGCTTAAQAGKRISVAVVLDPRPGSGVTRPVWSSSIETPAAAT